MADRPVPDLVGSFLGTIRFDYGSSKGRSCLDWARRSHPGVSWNELVIVMLCAEALHLSRYGRPVTGAAYGFEKDVAVSSDLATSAFVRSNPSVGEDGLPDDMSVSDAEAIEEVCRDLRALGLETLKKRAQDWRHGDRADYALMVDLERPGAEELLGDLAHFCRYIVF